MTQASDSVEIRFMILAGATFDQGNFGAVGVEGLGLGVPDFEIGGFFQLVGSAFEAVPDEGKVAVCLVNGNGFGDSLTSVATLEVFGHGLIDGSNGFAGRVAVKVALDIVGVSRCAVFEDGDEVGVGALGNLWGDAETAVVEAQVEVRALCHAEVALVGVVLDVVAEDVFGPRPP